MIIYIKIILYFGFIGSNIWLANENNKTRLKNIATKNTEQINHKLYGGLYLLACVLTLIKIFDFYFSASLLLQHACIFAVAYNEYADHPSFWLSPTSNAITDSIYRKLKLTTIFYPVLISTILSIGLFVYSIIR